MVKFECFYLNCFANVSEMEVALHEYIRYYNKQWIKSALNNLNLVQYRDHNNENHYFRRRAGRDNIGSQFGQ
ncbi:MULTISPECIES: IS3 family transposase [unclassified Avibacterium]|uniref:IS3 family transposase n=1 Tax=unclassified Avibacterium TaxID=2685287 RepID=UPI0037BE8CD3